MLDALEFPLVQMIQPPAEGEFNLRIGPGAEPGFVKLGPASEAPDHVVNTKAFPWPVEDASVDAVFAAFYFHRLTRPERYAFMNECARVLKPGKQLSLVVPHWSSMRAITDPLAEWPPLCEAAFMVYSRSWREGEHMADLPLTCNFGSVYGYGHQWDSAFDQSLIGRNDEYAAKAREQGLRELNRVTDLHVTLTLEG